MRKLESYQYGISNDDLKDLLINCHSFELMDVSIARGMHGRFLVTVKYIQDGEHKVKEIITTNSKLYDAWKSGMKDEYQDGEDGFENWQEVVKSLIELLNKNL